MYTRLNNTIINAIKDVMSNYTRAQRVKQEFLLKNGDRHGKN